MKEFEHTHLIDQYLKGILSPEEKERFESRMAEDEQLRQEVLAHQKMIHLIKANQLADDLREEGGRIRRIRTWRLIGISVMIGIFLALLFFVFIRQHTASDSKEPSSQTLFANHYHTPPAPPSVMGSQTNDHLAKGLRQYRIGNYSQALTIWAQKTTLSENDTARYYGAICMIELDQQQKALAELSQLPETSNYYDESLWFSALLYDEQQLHERALSLFRTYLENYPYGDYSGEINKILASEEHDNTQH